MNRQFKNKWALKKLFREVNTQLQRFNCCQFSKKAVIILGRRIGKNTEKLILTSMRLAENEGIDEVSGKHVILADNLLVHSNNRSFFRHLGTIGGIILGASLSTLLAMLSSNRYSVPALLVLVALSIIGTFMVTIHIAKDLEK